MPTKSKGERPCGDQVGRTVVLDDALAPSASPLRHCEHNQGRGKPGGEDIAKGAKWLIWANGAQEGSDQVDLMHYCQQADTDAIVILTSQSECQETKIQPAVASFLTGFVTNQVGPDYAYLGSLVVSMANRVYSINSCKALGGGGILLNFDGLLRADAAEHDEWAELVDDKRWSYKVLKAWYRRPRLGIKTCP
ncbi:hypothetical protein VSDG_09008 [Cytospora chrysosperma]|uniref:Uncharacterized protein n=1 Tax=Cytospora chrysosperma TaxID=252740 RepID=A0A423VDB3_CYTCH|nr:hypothetical protein VSDG_09008 [Valsa sordida]